MDLRVMGPTGFPDYPTPLLGCNNSVHNKRLYLLNYRWVKLETFLGVLSIPDYVLVRGYPSGQRGRA